MLQLPSVLVGKGDSPKRSLGNSVTLPLGLQPSLRPSLKAQASTPRYTIAFSFSTGVNDESDQLIPYTMGHYDTENL